MVHILKLSGKKIAFDSVSGAFVPLTSLANKMLGAIDLPLLPICPTSLRYELAKYDSEDVASTYEKLYELQEKGLLFAKETGEARLMVEGEYCGENTDEITMALECIKSEGKTDVTFVGFLSEADEIKKKVFN